MDQWRTAGYLRLSREDGDKAESDSIANQRAMLQTYIQTHPDLELVDFYQDDGCTGTHFDRPAFRRMEADLRSGKINCVLVKDLSRFGRDYIDMGRYLERVFPALGVRFIAINDHVDSGHGKYDILLPMKNIFNTQYARDISDKVRSAIHTKQQRGEFVGAFASYGYRKDPNRRGHLCIDPAAAQVVRRIFALFEAGAGKVRIAKLLNEEKIPSPSEYKRILGERYTNGRRLQNTTYWTYATIHRILQNRMYLGSMEQGRYIRPTLHGKAKSGGRRNGWWWKTPTRPSSPGRSGSGYRPCAAPEAEHWISTGMSAPLPGFSAAATVGGPWSRQNRKTGSIIAAAPISDMALPSAPGTVSPTPYWRASY